MRLRLVTPLQWCGVLLAAAGLLTATNVGAQQACPAAQITITQPTGGVASYPWTFGYSDTAAYGGTYTGDLVTNKVEPGNLETRYVYEPVTAGRPNSSDWDGRIARIEWADDGLEAGGTTTRVIQRVGNKLTYPGGASATYTYDDHDLAEVRNDQTGESVAYEYDHLHNVTSVRTAKEAGGTRLMQIAYTYAADGRTITAARATNLGGEVTEATYDLYQLPLVIRQKAVAGSGYADLVTQFTYSRLAGNVPLNLTAVTQGDGISNNLTTTFEYEPGHPQPTKVTDSTGAAWTTTYDTNTGLARFESSPTNSVGPDTAASTAQQVYNPDDTVKEVYDPLNHQQRRQYNRETGVGGDNLRINTYHVLGSSWAAGDPYSTVKIDPQGRPISLKDENGVYTNLSYTTGGNLREVIRDATGAAASQIGTVLFYNGYNQLSDARLPKYGTDATEVYVALDYERRLEDGSVAQPVTYTGRVTRLAQQESAGTWKYDYFGYDQAGNLAWHRKWDGNLVRYEYDELHRLARVDYPATAWYGTHSVTYQYDEFGRLSQMGDSTGITTYRYDPLGRLQSVAAGGRNTVTYSYVADTANRRWKTLVTSGGQTWEYRMDPKGRLSGVANPYGQQFYYHYDADGKPTALYREEATGTPGVFRPLGRTVYSYQHPRDWLSGITHYKTSTTGVESGLGSFTYHRTDGAGYTDQTGRILREVDAGGTTHSFQYDPHGRLVYEKDPDIGTREYFYDARGNRTRTKITKSGNTNNDYYTYNWVNQLLSVSRASGSVDRSKAFHQFTYDPAGRTATRERRLPGGTIETHEFRWDGQDKLRQVLGAGGFTAGYAGDGLRVNRSDLSATRVFHRSGSTVLQETGGAGGALTYTPGFAMRGATGDRLTYEDWLGSTRYTTDNNGVQKGGYAFDAFGRKVATAAGSDGQPQDFMWGGGWGYQSEDAASGLVLMGQRYYDPEVGRFLSPDPIGLHGGLNLYEYAESDPVGAVDPEGLSPGDIIGGVGVAISWGEAIAAPSPWTIGGAIVDTATELIPGIPGTSLRHGAKLLKALPSPAPMKALPAPPVMKALPEKVPPHGPYDHGPKPRVIKAGKHPTKTQSQWMREENMRRHGGFLRDDETGELLVRSKKSQKGVTPPQNEAQIDHVIARSNGGDNSYPNLRVRSRCNNRKKSNK